MHARHQNTVLAKEQVHCFMFLYVNVAYLRYSECKHQGYRIAFLSFKVFYRQAKINDFNDFKVYPRPLSFTAQYLMLCDVDETCLLHQLTFICDLSLSSKIHFIGDEYNSLG